MYVTFSVISGESQTLPAYVWYYSRIYLYTFVSLFIYVVLNLFIAVILDTYEIIKVLVCDGLVASRCRCWVCA